MHLRFPELREIPKAALERPFLAILGLKIKPDEEPPIVTAPTPRPKEEQDGLNNFLLEKIKANGLKGVKEALERGADPNAISKDTRTLFVSAIRSNTRIELIEMLISAGADIDSKDKDGNTPLIHATAKKRLDAVEILLDKGANPYSKNKKGKTALDYAQDLKLEKTKQILIDRMRQKPESMPEEKEKLNEQLIEAAKGRNLEIIREALEKGADIDARDKGPDTYGRTALIWAAENDFIDMAELLVENHADANAKDRMEVTALILAVRKNNIRMAELLLANHAEVNARTKDNETAMVSAATRGHQEMMVLLIKYGAIELELPTISAITKSPLPQKKLDSQLLEGAEKSNWNAAREALENGASVHARDGDGWTVLAYAACAGNLEIAKLAIDKKADTDSRDNGGRTPLMHASRKGHYDMVAFLLNRGADVNAESKHIENAIGFAEKGGYPPIAALLRSFKEKQGEQPRITKRFPAMLEVPEEKALPGGTIANDSHEVKKEKAGITLLNESLIKAAQGGDAEGVRHMVESGSDVNARNGNKMTALMSAAAAGCLDIVRFLAEKGATLDLKNTDGMTALMLAAGNGHEEVTEFLILVGADVREKNTSGKTALEIATGSDDKSHVCIIDMIRSAEERMHIDSLLLPAVVMGFSESVCDLLDKGADVNFKDEMGRIPIIQAITYGNEEMVELLISRGADLELKDNHGWTPLKHAAAEGFERIAKMLISAGAEVNARDAYGRTPLIEAAYHGRREIAELLILHKADADAKDKNQNMAADHAAANGHTEIMELLKKRPILA